MKLFLILFLQMASLLAWADKFEVRIAELSTVRQGESVRLGLISENGIADEELQERIYNLVINEKQDQDTSMTSEQVAVAIRDKLSFQDLQRVSFKIPEIVRIKVKANYLSPKDIAYKIKKDSLLVCSGCEVEIDELRWPELSSKMDILTYQLDTKVIQRAGSHLIPMYLETSQGRQTIYVNTRISFYKMAPVAKRMLHVGEKINEADVDMKRVSVSFAKDGVLETFQNKVAARLITAGQTIFMSDVKSEPAVLRGQSVKILIGTDSLEITAQGVAEDNGSIGDMVKVRSADNKKLLSGVLIEKGVVRIQ